MTPKEKAKELVTKYWNSVTMNMNIIDNGKGMAKEASLIGVNEILSDLGFIIPIEAFDFWQEVKTEIEKL